MDTAPSQIDRDIGVRIHALRSAGGLTLETLAQRSGVSRAMLSQMVSQSSNGAHHHRAVHARRACADFTAEPRGTEVELGKKSLSKLGDSARFDERVELAARLGIGIAGDPRARLVNQVHAHERAPRRSQIPVS